MDLDLEELAAVIELLDKSDFTDFRYEKGDLRLEVRRGGGAPTTRPTPPSAADTAPTAAPQPPSQPVSQPATPATERPAPEGTVGDPADGTVLIRAGLLGAFYRSPKPGDPPFVEIGDSVDVDTVVAIVEVMKLMNSVSAGVSGQITAIHASNGDLVEFGQPLFSVRPTP